MFDPQAIAGAPQTWWWNPLTTVETEDDAARLASHFIQGIRVGPSRRSNIDDLQLFAAEDLLAGLFLAAAVSGAGIREAHAWLCGPNDDEPVSLLFRHGHPDAARALRSLQLQMRETRSVIYEVARAATRCLEDLRVLAWIDQPRSTTLDVFDLGKFPLSTDTLYLLSREGGSSCGALAAAFTDQVIHGAMSRAETLGERLDPPLLSVLDAAASTTPIADLPRIFEQAARRGIALVTVLEGYRQGHTIWGDRHFCAMWDAATVKLIGATDDASSADDLYTLVGKHDSATAGGMKVEPTRRRSRRAAIPDMLRALRPHTAILLAAGARSAVVRLQPWFREIDAPVLAAATAAATKRIHDPAERRRLVAGLAAQGVDLPPVPVPPVLHGRRRRGANQPS